MKLRTAVAAIAALVASVCVQIQPVAAEQSSYTQASEDGSAFNARFPSAHQTWDNISKFEINPILRALFSNSYGTTCSAIANPYPYQWCVNATTRIMQIYTQPVGGGAFAWQNAFGINSDGSVSQPAILDGSIGGEKFAPGAAAMNIGFIPVQSVAGRGGNVTIASGDLTDATAAGRALLTAGSAAAQKAALGIASSDLTDATAAGRALLTAATPAAQRSAMSAAVSGSNGDITSLTGLTGPITSSAITALQLTGATAGIEHGSTTTPNTPYWDFHSSGNANDFDSRIIASGGAPASGNGILSFVAKSIVIPALDASAATQALTQTPYAGNVATTTSLSLKGPSVQTNLRNFLSTHSMNCVTDAARNAAAIHAYAVANSITDNAAVAAGQTLVNTDPIHIGCVVDYQDISASPGALQVWGWNTNVLAVAGFFAAGGYSLSGGEININLFDALSTGDADGDPASLSTTGYPSGYPNITAFGITAITANGTHRLTSAIGIGTDGQKEFNRGISFSAGTVNQCTICDYGSGSATVFDIRGGHSAYVLDTALVTGAPALRLSESGVIVARKADHSADYQVLSIANNQINIGSGSSGVIMWTGIDMAADVSYNLGSTAHRIASVTAANFVGNTFYFNNAGTPVAGASCTYAGAPTSSLVIQGGIVTHC